MKDNNERMSLSKYSSILLTMIMSLSNIRVVVAVVAVVAVVVANTAITIAAILAVSWVMICLFCCGKEIDGADSRTSADSNILERILRLLFDVG